ncbi:hypothetical protein J6590_087905 [Homalodisca vitripennis]|nr:hypothetical protein J6590_087905 [Homalodisca vitripennis]
MLLWNGNYIVSQALELLPSRDEAWLQLNHYLALNELLALFGMHRFSLPATRTTTTSRSSIDMVCTNLDDDQLSVEVLNTRLSDRTGQLTTLNILSEIKTLPQITCQHFSQENMNSLKQTLQNQSWDEIIQEENTETAYSKFLRTVTKSLDYACPYKRTRSRPANCKSAIFNAEAHNLKKKFVEAQDRYILIGRQEDKADAARKKKVVALTEFETRLFYKLVSFFCSWVTKLRNTPSSLQLTVSLLLQSLKLGDNKVLSFNLWYFRIQFSTLGPVSSTFKQICPARENVYYQLSLSNRLMITQRSYYCRSTT